MVEFGSLEYEYFGGPKDITIRERSCRICGFCAESRNNITNHCILHKLTELLEIEKRKRPGAFMPRNTEILERL